MSPAKSQRNKVRMARIACGIIELERAGICWQRWARERGLDGQAVKDVVAGRTPATRGETFRAAEEIVREADTILREAATRDAAWVPLKGLPLAIADWDGAWSAEHVFQVVAVELARRYAGADCHVLDTSQIAGNGFWRNRTGTADITACVSGRFVAIELKASSNQTDSQEREQERVENAAGTYVVARTMREVFEALGLEVPK